MAFRNLFKHHHKQHESDHQVENTNTDRRQSQELPPYDDASATDDQDVAQDAQKHAPPSTTTDVKEPRPSSQDQAPPDGQAPPPAYSTPPQSHPPQHPRLNSDPFDPRGQSYGYQYEESAQNFPHPSSVAKDIGKKMEYQDPKAADIARRASQGGREDLSEMMNYFLRQQELGKKGTDNTIAAWNGV